MEIRELIGRLDKEIALFKELISVLHRETESIVGRDYKGLYEVVGLKESALQRIAAAGAETIDSIRTLAKARGVSDEEASLARLASLSGPRGRDLDERREALKSLSQTVQEINALNSAIIRDSLDNINKTLGFLGNFVQPGTYRPSGSFGGFAVKGARLSEGA